MLNTSVKMDETSEKTLLTVTLEEGVDAEVEEVQAFVDWANKELEKLYSPERPNFLGAPPEDTDAIGPEKSVDLPDGEGVNNLRGQDKNEAWVDKWTELLHHITYPSVGGAAALASFFPDDWVGLGVLYDAALSKGKLHTTPWVKLVAGKLSVTFQIDPAPTTQAQEQI